MSESNRISKIEQKGAQIKSTLSKSLKNMISFKRFIYYMYDYKNKVGELIPSYSHAKIYKLKSTGEQFLLDSPSFYIGDKPVYICRPNFNLSIKLKFREIKVIDKNTYKLYQNAEFQEIISKKILTEQELDSIIKKRILLVEEGYTPSEIDAKTQSQYTAILFRRFMYSPQTILIFITSIILTGTLLTLMYQLMGFLKFGE